MSNQVDCRNAVFYGMIPNLAGIIWQPAADVVSNEVFHKIRLCRFRFRVQMLIEWDRIHEQSEQPDTPNAPG